MNARCFIFATVFFTAILSIANPIVWLHGWNSNGSLWEDLQAQMVQSASASTDDFLTLSYYSGGLGFTTASPIEEVAQAVSREIVNFYEERNDGVPLDVVAHSMGGLVFRSMSSASWTTPSFAATSPSVRHITGRMSIIRIRRSR